AKRKLPTVATGDVHYLRHEDARAHEALLCIQSGDSLKNPDRWRFETDHFYFKSPDEMAEDFPGHDEAMRRTLEVAERCNVELALGNILLPKFPVPNDRDAFDYLVELCEKGLAKRYGTATPDLNERLQFELKTIKEMGFPDYFLIVWDFIHFAKQDGIAVGPGRGSAAGSLVAYCLEITDIDPIRYDLLFERFLNPERKTMPDMDIDFAVAGREPLIEVVLPQQKGSDQEVVTQFAMKDVEALGLLKMDFLGLRNLDVIEKAAELAGGIDISGIPLDDPQVYQMLSRGEAAGVFQFESSGMLEALRQVRPTEFDVLIALGS